MVHKRLSIVKNLKLELVPKRVRLKFHFEMPALKVVYLVQLTIDRMR